MASPGDEGSAKLRGIVSVISDAIAGRAVVGVCSSKQKVALIVPASFGRRCCVETSGSGERRRSNDLFVAPSDVGGVTSECSECSDGDSSAWTGWYC
jgi:hypothetical protein